MGKKEIPRDGNVNKRKRTESNVDSAKHAKKRQISEKGLVVNIPCNSKECSVNWKALSNELNNEKKQNSLQGKKKEVKKKGGLYRKAKIDHSLKLTHEKDPEIWFDDVESEDIISARNDSAGNKKFPNHHSTDKILIKQNAYSGLTKAIGMDCEMVGVGHKGSQSVLARVSLVNQFGKCIYDKHVKPLEQVTDYRTFVSGIRPSDLKGAEEFETVQREVAEILKGRIVVGHALSNDMKVLFLNHPRKLIRDTAQYKPFREHNKGRTPALRHLCKQILGIEVQKGEHSSVQDAQAAMRLYTMHKKQWEREIRLMKSGIPPAT